MLEVVAEHKISVLTNPFQGLDKIPELVELAHSGKMKGKGIVIVDPKQM
jgi:propanol-preferring alcohol dehydrogenase